MGVPVGIYFHPCEIKCDFVVKIAALVEEITKVLVILILLLELFDQF